MAIYINGIFCKKSNYGIKLSGDADKICAEIQANKRANGSIRLELKERKEVDKNGNSHYLTVDEWEPTKVSNDKPKDSFVDEGNDLPF